MMASRGSNPSGFLIDDAAILKKLFRAMEPSQWQSGLVHERRQKAKRPLDEQPLALKSLMKR
jgi:hypothetical protein